MGNLRVTGFAVLDSRNIRVNWTVALDPEIGASNLVFRPLDPGIVTPRTIQVSVVDRTMDIQVLPLIPGALYEVEFVSTPQVPFGSANGQDFLPDGSLVNTVKFRGFQNPVNPIRDNLVAALANNVYNLASDTFVFGVLSQVGETILRSIYDIGAVRNSSYLAVLVVDEEKERGSGPYDRLDEESAYEVLRVARTPTDTSVDGRLDFSAFPDSLVSLQVVSVSGEKLEARTGPGTFDRFVLTLEKSPVIGVQSVQIAYADGYAYTYPLTVYGFNLLDSRYDQSASDYFVLAPDQVRLSEQALDDPAFRVPGPGDEITISYSYKDRGRFIDGDSVEVSRTRSIAREAVPALLNAFTLAHAPIVNSSDEIPTTGAVQFLDPETVTPFQTIHPAFRTELPFLFENRPRNPGEYSVDYATGRVFVFGADTARQGTGNFPPAASYLFRRVFEKDLDYAYDPDTFDLVPTPDRNLVNQEAKVTFVYESALVPDVDYFAQVHQEEINERVQNRLINGSSVRVLHPPVTNAFRVFNETSGEVYPITRITSDAIHFTSQTFPRVSAVERERATFRLEVGETLLLLDETVNTSSVRVFRFQVDQAPIIANTEDLVGASFSSSVSFSQVDVFQKEIYYDDFLSVAFNRNRLAVGEYAINYGTGEVYVGVTAAQLVNVGVVTYRTPAVVVKHPSVISVSDVYFNIDQNLPAIQQFNYTSFTPDEVFPETFEQSNERFFDDDPSRPYIVDGYRIAVDYAVDGVRHIFDVEDLDNSPSPIDFVPGATFVGSVVILDPTGVPQRDTLTVSAGLSVTIPVPASVTGIEIQSVQSAIVTTPPTYTQLLDGLQVVAGKTVTFSGASGAAPGDRVDLQYRVRLTGAATPTVDYDHGGYYLDYTALTDEILISYEHGDNNLDFSASTALGEGDTYYATYRVGALRDVLLSNFGDLVAIPEFQSFNTEFSREVYRDALVGALQSFTKGPTIPALEEMVSSVTKITPEIREAIYELWSLGVSYLFPQPVREMGNPQLLPGRYDQGAAFLENGDAFSFPVSSNVRLEEGTFQAWVIPEWDGLDNDATLTFLNVARDGYLLEPEDIYIGVSGAHPEIVDGAFSVSRTGDPSPIGVPAAMVVVDRGLFVFFDSDEGRWKVVAKDTPEPVGDGYFYTGSIALDGEFYDVQLLDSVGTLDFVRTGIETMEFGFEVAGDGYCLDGYTGYPCPGLAFMADQQHYFFDFQKSPGQDRMSLYKDGSGFLNFEVWDRGGGLPNPPTRRNRYQVSADIQNWKAGERHNIAAAWRLNSADHMDEIHLFVDGLEVPNILRYGGRPIAALTDRFRTVEPEVIAGLIPRPIVGGPDLATRQGSAEVTSPSKNFEALGILPGDVIEIFEPGFAAAYAIVTVTSHTLGLGTVMPATLSDASYSVNPYSVIVPNNVDLSSNVAVSLLRGGEEIEIPGVHAEDPAYEIARNASNETVLTIIADAEEDDQILIRTLGLNYRRCRDEVFIWGDTQSVLKTDLPIPVSLDDTEITKVLLPLLPVGPENAVVVGPDFVATWDGYATQPTNIVDGRQLAVRVTGGNVDFSTPTEVTIEGSESGGPTSETLFFSLPGTDVTTTLFTEVDRVIVTTRPLDTSYDGTAVEIREALPVTVVEPTTPAATFPIIRFAYPTHGGTDLEGDGSDVVSDPEGIFAISDPGNLLSVTAPPLVAGVYEILERIDGNTVRVSPTPAGAFSGGAWEVYSVSQGRGGFQNGFFFLEEAGTANTPFPLTEGVYAFDFPSYLQIPFAPLGEDAFLGNSASLTRPAKATMDEVRILSRALTDTRVGESLAGGDQSITTGALSLSPFIPDPSTLVLLHCNTLPPENSARFYRAAERGFIQTAPSVNARFEQAILITSRGLTFENQGRLDPTKEGTLEFWVSPRFDTRNDPLERYYFDAAGAVNEDVVSTSKLSVLLPSTAREILSVEQLAAPGVNFFTGGSLGLDRQSITLGSPLPFSRTPVRVTFVPTGFQGDRISIYKDSGSNLVFSVRARGTTFSLQTPIVWGRQTWHRVRATFRFNSATNQDEMRLFVDSEERAASVAGSALAGSIVAGQAGVSLSSQALVGDIDFLDDLLGFSVGEDFRGANQAQARMDNLRLSNVARTPYFVFGQAIDPNYNSNLDVVYPVIEDAFTTFLLDFNTLLAEVTDFAILRDAAFGLFSFIIDILDSFHILSDSPRARALLESAILALKPATARVGIQYST